MELPATTLPTEHCCGHPTHQRGVKYRNSDFTPPPKTAGRWVIVGRWQCHVTEQHSGDWWYTTDDAEAEPPFRTVNDPAARASVLTPLDYRMMQHLDPKRPYN